MTSISLWSSIVRSAVTHHLNPQLCSPQHPDIRYIHRCATVLGPINQSANERLFVDPARDSDGGESNETASKEGSAGKLTQLGSPGLYQNWTGEESMQDAVLRMLVDKYKSLRFGPIRTADQKLKESPPQVRQSTVFVQAALLLLHADGKKSQTRRCFLASRATDLGIRPLKHLGIRLRQSNWAILHRPLLAHPLDPTTATNAQDELRESWRSANNKLAGCLRHVS